MWSIAFAVIVPQSVNATMADELCPRLRAFEAAQLPGAERRWIEFHWGFDKASIWSWGCRHSPDQLAKTTCQWLMQHTNQEFSMMLPHRIMACYGYRFPKFAYYDWNGMIGTVRLRGRNDRRLLMDLDYGHLPAGEEAVRVSVEDPDKSYEPDELPRIEPMARDTPAPAAG
jgi:hypothetical protein